MQADRRRGIADLVGEARRDATKGGEALGLAAALRFLAEAAMALLERAGEGADLVVAGGDGDREGLGRFAIEIREPTRQRAERQDDAPGDEGRESAAQCRHDQGGQQPGRGIGSQGGCLAQQHEVHRLSCDRCDCEVPAA